MKAKEAELSALEQTTDSKLKMAQQKVCPLCMLPACLTGASAHH